MADSGISGALTDGAGIATFTASKLLKDVVLDFLLALPPALVAINIGNLDQAVAAPVIVGFAIADVAIRVVYRALLKWAQTP